MLTIPNQYPMLTDEQSTQIETFKTQVLNMETDIAIYAKTLSELKNSIISATKENNYLEERNASLIKETVELETKVGNLKSQVEESVKQVETAQKEADVLKNLYNATQTDLELQKADLSDKQADFRADRLKLDEQIKLNEEVKQDLDQRKYLISELITKL